MSPKILATYRMLYASQLELVFQQFHTSVLMYRLTGEGNSIVTFETYFERISKTVMIFNHCSKHHTLWITHRSNVVNYFQFQITGREGG